MLFINLGFIFSDNLEKQLTTTKSCFKSDSDTLESMVTKFYRNNLGGSACQLDTTVNLDTSIFRDHATMISENFVESGKLTMERLGTLLNERITVLTAAFKEVLNETS